MNTAIDYKAKELVDKFREEIYRGILSSANIDPAREKARNEKAKQCALICVDEILKLNTWVDEDYQRDNPKLIDIEDTEEFWQKVKEKIQSL